MPTITTDRLGKGKLGVQTAWHSYIYLLSRFLLYAILWTAARQASLSITTPRACLTHVYQVGDAIQPSHPLLSPSPPALNLSQYQGLFFASGGQSIGTLASVLPMNIQDRFPLGLAGLISLQSKELSRVFSNTTVQKHQFFSAQLSLWSDSHIHT